MWSWLAGLLTLQNDKCLVITNKEIANNFLKVS